MTETNDKPKAPKRYYVVNEAGAIHEVTKELAADLLKRRNKIYRMATSGEVAKLKKAKGKQAHNKPIAPPRNTDPDSE